MKMNDFADAGKTNPIRTQTNPIKPKTNPKRNQNKPNFPAVSKTPKMNITSATTVNYINELRTTNYELIMKNKPNQTQFQTRQHSRLGGNGLFPHLRPGWWLAVQPDNNGKIERQKKMKIFVDTIRIFVQNTSMEPVVTSLSDNLKFMARAYLSVRTVTLQLLGVINPWPSFMRY